MHRCFGIIGTAHRLIEALVEYCTSITQHTRPHNQTCANASFLYNLTKRVEIPAPFARNKTGPGDYVCYCFKRCDFIFMAQV